MLGAMFFGHVQIMCEVGKSDIQDHVRMRLEAEREEKEQRKREKQEAHLYTVFRIVTDQDITAQIGQNRWFDLADQEKVRFPGSAPLHLLLSRNRQSQHANVVSGGDRMAEMKTSLHKCHRRGLTLVGMMEQCRWPAGQPIMC